jgi:hypothetical protein
MTAQDPATATMAASCPSGMTVRTVSTPDWLTANTSAQPRLPGPFEVELRGCVLVTDTVARILPWTPGGQRTARRSCARADVSPTTGPREVQSGSRVCTHIGSSSGAIDCA